MVGSSDGTPVQRGDEPPLPPPAFALLIPRDDWWTAAWNREDPGSPFHYEVYIDVSTPARWEPRRVTMVDLDLDVVRTRSGECSIRDGDEFAAQLHGSGTPQRSSSRRPVGRHAARSRFGARGTVRPAWSGVSPEGNGPALIA